MCTLLLSWRPILCREGSEQIFRDSPNFLIRTPGAKSDKIRVSGSLQWRSHIRGTMGCVTKKGKKLYELGKSVIK